MMNFLRLSTLSLHILLIFSVLSDAFAVSDKDLMDINTENSFFITDSQKPEKSRHICYNNSEEMYNAIIQSTKYSQFVDVGNEFELLQNCYPFSKYTTQSYLISAYFQLKSDQIKEAIESLESFMLIYPDESHDYALYLLAKLHIKSLKDSKRDVKSALKAVEIIDMIKASYPNSVFLNELLAYKNTLINISYDKELSIVRFYLAKGLYHSALIRCFNMLDEKKYNDIFEPEILYRIAEAFNALNILDERNKFINKLKTKFPKSDWASNVEIII
ncbi:outer membrane protein assembly factor BamD [Anaplasmataceae bacterium AB001_6]|nr:outer membrane protein assembly factor BamD [Anaplasmataceae bacterium AB001_6]